MKRKSMLLGTLFLLSMGAVKADVPDFSSSATEFLQQMKNLFPPVVGIIFIAMVLYNIGDIMGDHKNYQAFFKKIGLFVGGLIIVFVIFTWITGKRL